MSHKKRRLVDETSQTTSSSSNARNTREGESEEEQQPSQSNTSQPVYLSEYVGEFNHSAVKMPCSHIFGKGCLCEWLKLHTTCPLCRFSVLRKLHQNQLQMIQPITFHFSQYPLTATLTPWEMLLFRTILLMPLQTINLHHECIILDLVRFHHQALPPITEPQGLRQQKPIKTYICSTRARREREARQDQESNEFHIDPFAFDYLRNRLSTSDRQPEPLFPFGMSSRRTANGVETTLTDHLASESEDNLNMRSLFDASPMPEARRNEDDTRVGDSDLTTKAQTTTMKALLTFHMVMMMMWTIHDLYFRFTRYIFGVNYFQSHSLQCIVFTF